MAVSIKRDRLERAGLLALDAILSASGSNAPMAPVGHTRWQSPQKSQLPRWKFSLGVRARRKPSPTSATPITPVWHTLRQRSHFTHEASRCSSSCAPGGRTSAVSDTPSAAFTAPPNAANTAAAPQNPANARRVYAAMAYAAWPIIWSSNCRKPSVMSATPR